MITRRKLLALLGCYLLAACSPLVSPPPQPTQFPIETRIPPTQEPTETPTVTPVPTKTSTPTPLPTRTPTATPDPILQVPKIEGLTAKEVDGKIVYYAEAGNPYGLKEGELAGRVVDIKIARGVKFAEAGDAQGEAGTGVVLHEEVVRRLAEAEPWKIPFFFDPQGELEIIDSLTPDGRHKNIFFKDTAAETFVSPYILFSLSKYYTHEGFFSVHFFTPIEFNSDKITNLGITLYYLSGNNLIDNFGKEVNFGETVLTNAKGILPTPPFPPGISFTIEKASHRGPVSLPLEDFLFVGSSPVFMMAQ